MNAVLKYKLSAKLVEGNTTVDSGMEELDLQIPDISEKGDAVIKVASGETDYEQSLSNVDASKFLIIRTDQSISVKLNDSGNTAISIVASGTTKRGLLFLTGGAATTLFITNSSGSIANVEIFYGS